MNNGEGKRKLSIYLDMTYEFEFRISGTGHEPDSEEKTEYLLKHIL